MTGCWWRTSCDDVRSSLRHKGLEELEIAATVLRQEGEREKTKLRLIEGEIGRRVRSGNETKRGRAGR